MVRGEVNGAGVPRAVHQSDNIVYLSDQLVNIFLGGPNSSYQSK